MAINKELTDRLTEQRKAVFATQPNGPNQV